MSTLDWDTHQGHHSIVRPDPAAGAQVLPACSANQDFPVSSLEFTLVVFVLYLATTARLPFVSSVTADGPGTIVGLLRMAGYIISGVLVVGFYRDSLGGALRIPSLMTLVLLCGASMLWSLQPETSRAQGGVLLAMTALGVYIGERFTQEGILKLVCVTTAVVTLMSIVMLLLDPGNPGIQDLPVHGLTGVFVHKNLMGQSMSLGALAWAFSALASPHHRLRNLLVLGVTILLLILCNSMTSILAFMLVIALLPLLRYAASGSTGAVVMLAAIIPTVPFIIPAIERSTTALLMNVGRDPSFTGRTDIWQYALDALSHKPILGFGFAAFWQDPTIATATETLFYWAPPTAHNGYLDIALSVGIAGLILLVWSLLVSIRNAFAFARERQNMIGLFPLALLVFFLIYNTTESISGVQPNILWILFIVVAVSMAKWRATSTGDDPEEKRGIREDHAPTNDIHLPNT